MNNITTRHFKLMVICLKLLSSTYCGNFTLTRPRCDAFNDTVRQACLLTVVNYDCFCLQVNVDEFYHSQIVSKIMFCDGNRADIASVIYLNLISIFNMIFQSFVKNFTFSV